ncbi:MAG: transposase [Coriobacteriales bacterium]|nr:transposase [Coriobacteriales bacterium]
MDTKDPNELIELAKLEGIPLTDEELDQIAGGGTLWDPPKRCPKCGSTKIHNYTSQWFCKSCGHKWTQGII